MEFKHDLVQIIPEDVRRYIMNDIATSVAPRQFHVALRDIRAISADFDDVVSRSPINIMNVIFHDPATIVFWSDGTKTVVKCQSGDKFDPEKGLAMAIVKKMTGNTGSYCNIFKKWVKEEKSKETVIMCTGDNTNMPLRIRQALKDAIDKEENDGDV